MSELPTLRWGIIGAGWVSSEMVKDLTIERPDAKAKHVIQAIGCSSISKGQEFVQKHIPHLSPTVYGSYQECYNDKSVDLIYIATPNGLHKQQCLDAIAAGKHVLCEKSFAITANEAKEVFAAAKEKGVFVMEAMFTRFLPITQAIQKAVHQDKMAGDVVRVFADFAMGFDAKAKGMPPWMNDPNLGAGTLLNIGIYALTWGLLCLDVNIGEKSEKPKVVSLQSLDEGLEVASSIILLYPSTGRQGILTSGFGSKTSLPFAKIEGSKGTIIVEGVAASVPRSFKFVPKGKDPKEEVFEFEKPGWGFYHEADAVALDIQAGRLENATMPWGETIRVLEIMDGVRHSNGLFFPQEK